MATKTERRLRKIALRRKKTEAAAAAENSAAAEVSAEPSAPETASGGAPMRGYPHEAISEDEMSGTGVEEYNSHDDINADRVQEMGQEGMTSYFNHLRQDFNQHRTEFNKFMGKAQKQLSRQWVTILNQGNEMERMRREMKMEDQRIDELDAKVTEQGQRLDSIAAEMAEIKAALLAGRG